MTPKSLFAFVGYLDRVRSFYSFVFVVAIICENSNWAGSEGEEERHWRSVCVEDNEQAAHNS